MLRSWCQCDSWCRVSGLLRDIVCNQLKFQNTGRQTENMTGVVFNTISLIIFSPSESGDAAEIGDQRSDQV